MVQTSTHTGAIKVAIPVAPNGVDVTWQGTPVRLCRARSGTGSKSPVEVVCEEI